MCRLYGNPPRYARACYRTGHAGLHVLIDDAHFKNGGCLILERPKAMRAPRQGVMLHFRVSHYLPEVVRDMARYARAKATHIRLDGVTYVSLQLPPRRDTQESQRRLQAAFVARASSFGWTAVEWREGLPSPQ